MPPTSDARSSPQVSIHRFLARRSFYPLLLCSALSIAFLLGRVYLSRSLGYHFLVWNLFLAWLPYFFSLGAVILRRTRSGQIWPTLTAATLWIITFPNAPYIFTDLVHLQRNPMFIWWYDLGMILAFALTGCFLAIVSLRIMQDLIRPLTGTAISWAFVCASVALSGFGVYLGRFQRFNSWDLVTNPLRLGSRIFSGLGDPMSHPRTCGVTIMFGALLLVCYIMFTSMAPRNLAVETED